MKIYLDTCCYSRLRDDQSILEIRNETLSIRRILDLIDEGRLDLVTSEILEYEISMNPNEVSRITFMELLQMSNERVEVDREVFALAETVRSIGIDFSDALHLVCAAKSDCFLFITVDKGILKSAREISKVLRIGVMNPIMCLSEVGEEP
ncbi:MAG: PIN domain-containing protein [Candidatus Omnitrophica bacterium]|nr:PIN domain-containing protein [Candidatus Omnitrophota bacterium]MCB9770454.1 PIN domain-containing protein [Candidatus Omnitrophota bacterium]MCB9783478.1 PIN domain-containing protein [Candidatus Omnitrophota bacterium]